MLDKKDAQWWVSEVEKHPESAADLIRLLADRLAFLDKQNEALRGELIALRRKQGGETVSVSRADQDGSVSELTQRVRQLESVLRQGNASKHVLIYGPDRIEMSLPAAPGVGVDRVLPNDVKMLVCEPDAQLLIITAEAQAFILPLAGLPVPGGRAIAFGSPNNVAAIVALSTVEQSRFLLLHTRAGYVYSLIAGSAQQHAKRREKLLRNLIPGDPIVGATPSYNGDVFALSQKGRWTRFPEKAIAPSGSQAMELPTGDSLLGLAAFGTDTDLAFLTTEGRFVIQPSADFKPRRTPGSSSGMILKGQSLIAVSCAESVAVLTRSGKVLTFHIPDVPYRARSEEGWPLAGLTAGDAPLALIGY